MKFEGGDRSISGIYGKEVGMKFNHLEKPPPLPRIQGTCFGSFILYCPFSCIHILWRREVKSGLAEQWIRNLGGRGNENNPFVEKPFLLRNHDEPNYASHPENFIISGGESQILPVMYYSQNSVVRISLQNTTYKKCTCFSKLFFQGCCKFWNKNRNILFVQNIRCRLIVLPIYLSVLSNLPYFFRGITRNQ